LEWANKRKVYIFADKIEKVNIMSNSAIIDRDKACFLLIDPQTSFIESSDTSDELLELLRSMLRLCGAYLLPTIVTIENPTDVKGLLPPILEDALPDGTYRFNKNTFDCMSELEIKEQIANLNRSHIVVAGCETDVCLMQSCLHLIDEGYTVFFVDDLCFTSTRDDRIAKERLTRAGVIFVSYKMVYYELLRSVDRSSLGSEVEQRLAACGAIEPI
jgi:nicotinamidase-related amidase